MSDEEILALVAQESGLPRERLDMDARLGTLDISSIDMVSLLFEVEDRYGVEIEPEQVTPEMTLGELVNRIREKAKA
ncbi:acyl carrier protein [Croceicoccus marinus]|uniref:Acyl carrier protein n=1 Tax=Croceicoccus marinus TaxID=450378 RepID=A0A7G6VSJ9_9SPHN|nr:acyl carrier protein [Croceicoccus marinus]QNE04714.1 acyl carrier protein [Croceicoccus marinus]